jgi:hypothetical protein
MPRIPQAEPDEHQSTPSYKDITMPVLSYVHGHAAPATPQLREQLRERLSEPLSDGAMVASHHEYAQRMIFLFALLNAIGVTVPRPSDFGT